MGFIKRHLSSEMRRLLKEYPVVLLLGPRQSGKTTLAKILKYEYHNLEHPEKRHWAMEDPKDFLYHIKTPVILDEIQRVPQLLSYIQVKVDETKRNGQFVLTGSHQPQIQQATSQSLAGRVGLLELLPLSILELANAGISYKHFQDYAHNGFLPRIYDQKQRPLQAYSNYYRTYVERDIRQLINLKNQNLFEKFMVLLAGRSGQIINYHSLANDVGCDLKTIKHWLSLLEASFVIYQHRPYFENLGKRVIKSPKYYFTEVGLLCFLLGIQKPSEVTYHPLVGQIFENLVVIECLKAQRHRGHTPSLYFFQDSNHKEIDILYPTKGQLKCFEIKSTSTYQPFMKESLKKIITNYPKVKEAFMVYNGLSRRLSDHTQMVHFKKIHKLFS